MNNKSPLPLIAGTSLIGIGLISLAGNLFLQVQAWRMWPVVVLLAGLGLTAPGLFAFKNRGLGSFFIPGIPVLAVGSILMVASLSGQWAATWVFAWPLVVLALALGFGLAALSMRVVGLAFPAFILGINGLVLAFTNWTGLWMAWALLWPVEPLSVGLPLLLTGWVKRSEGTRLAGLILCSVAGAGFFFTSFMSMFNGTILRFGVPGMLIITGVIIIAASFLKFEKSILPETPTQPEAESPAQA